jgi:DNA-binding protein H-NS
MSEPLTLRRLLEQRDELDARISAMQAEMREDVLAQLKATIHEFDFTAYELGLVKTQHVARNGRDARTFTPKAKPTPQPPLYRDPNTGATWSGRGRAPHWLDGHTDDYLIK